MLNEYNRARKLLLCIYIFILVFINYTMINNLMMVMNHIHSCYYLVNSNNTLSKESTTDNN